MNIVWTNATPNKILGKKPKEHFFTPEDVSLRKKVIKNYVFSPEYRVIS